MRPALTIALLAALLAGAHAFSLDDLLPDVTCIYCDAGGNRKSYSLLKERECEWDGQAVVLDKVDPIDFLFNWGCPDEVAGRTFVRKINGCPDPEDATECPSADSSPAPTACVYCDPARNRKTLTVNGAMTCEWAGELVALDELAGEAACPSEHEGMTLVTQGPGCPNPEENTECAAMEG